MAPDLALLNIPVIFWQLIRPYIVDCGDMSGGGGSFGNSIEDYNTMTCYAVYPTTNPYAEMPLDTVSFNITQVGSVHSILMW